MAVVGWRAPGLRKPHLLPSGCESLGPLWFPFGNFWALWEGFGNEPRVFESPVLGAPKGLGVDNQSDP